MKLNKLLVGTALAVSSLCAQAAGSKSINISDTATYYDEKVIASNIKSECVELGSQFSASTKKFLESDGWSVNLNSDLDNVKDGTKLKLQITNATSSGNAFIGHNKSVSVEAKLYTNGKLVDTFTGSRNSSGGFAGGFKGSCSILARCVNTLGSDVSKWLSNKSL